jgi:xanthine dehydrogenase YagS FAD-binding subunit
MLCELPEFQHIDVHDVAEAVDCLHRYVGRACVIAGATDLLALMKDRIEGPGLKSPEILVNIKRIPGIDTISYDEGSGLRIGAGATLTQLQAAGVIAEKFTLLAQAAGAVGATQLRNVGTIGGNLCQRPRCAYFRHPHFVCFKKGGTRCYAVAGEHRFYHAIFRDGTCITAHPSDMAPALIALRAQAVIAGPDGERRIPLRDFFVGTEQLTETRLKPDEFILAVEVPEQQGTRHVFVKQRVRRAADFALASVAVAARISSGVFTEGSVTLGGVASQPHVAQEAEELLKGNELTKQLITDAAEAALEGAKPLPGNRYKVDLAKAIVRGALTSLIETNS